MSMLRTGSDIFQSMVQQRQMVKAKTACFICNQVHGGKNRLSLRYPQDIVKVPFRLRLNLGQMTMGLGQYRPLLCVHSMINMPWLKSLKY
jgi:hypothetical protein